MKTATPKRRRFLKTMAFGAAGTVASAGTAVAASLKSRPPSFAEEFVPLWNRAKECTIEYAAAMPEETYDFKPVPEVRSFADQMLHIADTNVWFLNTYISSGNTFSRDYPPAGKSKEQVLELVNEAFDKVGEVIGGMTDEQMAESVQTFVGPLPRKDVILMLRDHVTHHRGQSVVYLRLNGIVPPTWVGH